MNVSAHVIAPGGSLVYRQKAMEHLQSDGIIIHLDLALKHLKKRLDDMHARGVVIAPDQKLDDIYAERRLLYLKYADATAVTDGLTANQVVGEKGHRDFLSDHLRCFAFQEFHIHNAFDKAQIHFNMPALLI